MGRCPAPSPGSRSRATGVTPSGRVCISAAVAEDSSTAARRVGARAVRPDRFARSTNADRFRQECQVQGWTEKGHKKHCKVLRDRNVRMLLMMDYSVNEGFFRFS